MKNFKKERHSVRNKHSRFMFSPIVGTTVYYASFRQWFSPWVGVLYVTLNSSQGTIMLGNKYRRVVI